MARVNDEVPVWIALGSNLGNRIGFLRVGLDAIGSISTSTPVCSSIYESAPIGPADKPFLNAVIRTTTSLSPEQLLHHLKAAEADAGRDFTQARWTNRPLDLDIIAYGREVITTKNLTIPHKEYSKRLFVLLPLHELEPGWTDPRTGTPVNRWIDSITDQSISKTALTWEQQTSR